MFPTEAEAIEYLAQWRWPEGFVCPRCEERHATRLATRPLWECHGCGYQASVTAGTVMAHTHVPLRLWLYGFWLLGRRKKGTSALQFQRETGIGSYRTALYLLHRVREVLGESREHPLSGTVEVDEAVIPGRGMYGKHLGEGGTFILAAVERVDVEANDGTSRSICGSARVYIAPSVDEETLCGFVEATVEEGSRVVTDGWMAYANLVQLGVHHDSHDQLRNPAVSKRHLGRVHIVFSNLKNWLRGTHHWVSLKHMGRYIDEFVYRFNRRYRDPATFGFLVRRAMNSPWRGIRALIAEGSAWS